LGYHCFHPQSLPGNPKLTIGNLIFYDLGTGLGRLLFATILLVDGKRFGELIGEAIDSLPSQLAQKLNNVAVIVQDNPMGDQLRELGLSKKDLLFGLYQGIPQTKRGHYSGVIPDKITIFKKSIEIAAKTEDEVKEKIRDTVMHEIGHHFGLSDKDLR